jgi:hypothetical protein
MYNYFLQMTGMRVDIVASCPEPIAILHVQEAMPPGANILRMCLISTR